MLLLGKLNARNVIQFRSVTIDRTGLLYHYTVVPVAYV